MLVEGGRKGDGREEMKEEKREEGRGRERRRVDQPRKLVFITSFEQLSKHKLANGLFMVWLKR